MIGGHAGAVQEHLVEVGLAGDLLDRADLDAVLAHRKEEERDAAVLGDVPVGPGDQHAVVGTRRPRRPDLLTRDDELVAVALGTCLQPGEVRPGSGLGIEQAHLDVVEQQRADETALHRFRPERKERVGPEVVDVLAGTGGPGTAELLDDDSCMRNTQPEAEPLTRPGRHRVAGVDDELKPLASRSVGAPVRLQPATNLGLQRCGLRDVNTTSDGSKWTSCPLSSVAADDGE